MESNSLCRIEQVGDTYRAYALDTDDGEVIAEADSLSAVIAAAADAGYDAQLTRAQQVEWSEVIKQRAIEELQWYATHPPDDVPF